MLRELIALKKSSGTWCLTFRIDKIVNDVDVVILSIPTKAIPDLPKDLFADVSENVILVDTSNY